MLALHLVTTGLGLFLFPLVWLAGGWLSMTLGAGAPEVLTVASFLVVGGLLALDFRLSARAVTVIVIVLGLMHDSMNGAARPESRNGLHELAGVATSLFVLVALASAPAVSLTRPWTRIACRVAGSWVVATGLLLPGWQARR